jgi:hypothetical protein
VVARAEAAVVLLAAGPLEEELPEAAGQAREQTEQWVERMPAVMRAPVQT